MAWPAQEQSQKEKSPGEGGGGTREEVTELLKQIRNSVSEFEKYIPVILTYLQNLCNSFKAGVIRATKLLQLATKSDFYAC